MGVFILQRIVEWHALVIFDDPHTFNHPPLAQQAQITDGLQRNLSSQLLQSIVIITTTKVR
jgi:hypothetical protein